MQGRFYESELKHLQYIQRDIATTLAGHALRPGRDRFSRTSCLEESVRFLMMLLMKGISFEGCHNDTEHSLYVSDDPHVMRLQCHNCSYIEWPRAPVSIRIIEAKE